MVTILNEAPGFGSSFGRALGGGVSQGVGAGLQHAMKLREIKGKEEEKNKFLSQLFNGEMPNKNKTDLGETSKKQEFSLSPEQETVLALTDPQKFNAYKTLKEGRQKENEKIQQTENLQGTLEQMIGTLMEGNLGLTPNKFIFAKGRRDAQYFDSLGLQLESIGKDMVSKGVLAAPRFAYLLSNLPSSGKTDASNAGAIEAWSEELKLKVPGLERLKSLYEEKKTGKKVKPGTPLDEKSVAELHEEFKGNRAAMEKAAKARGYLFQ